MSADGNTQSGAVRFHVSLWDFFLANFVSGYTDPVQLSIAVAWGIILALGLAVPNFAQQVANGWQAVLAVILLPFFAGLFLYAIPLFVMVVARTVLNYWFNREYYQDVEATVTPTHFLLKSSTLDISLPWKFLFRVDHIPGYILIYYSRTNEIVIPKKSFGSLEEADEFYGRCRRLYDIEQQNRQARENELKKRLQTFEETRSTSTAHPEQHGDEAALTRDIKKALSKGWGPLKAHLEAVHKENRKSAYLEQRLKSILGRQMYVLCDERDLKKLREKLREAEHFEEWFEQQYESPFEASEREE